MTPLEAITEAEDAISAAKDSITLLKAVLLSENGSQEFQNQFRDKLVLKQIEDLEVRF